MDVYWHARKLWGALKKQKGYFRLTKEQEIELCEDFLLIPFDDFEVDQEWEELLPRCLQYTDDDDW